MSVNPKEKLDGKKEKIVIKIPHKNRSQISQKKIIREVFSPPIKQKKRRNQDVNNSFQYGDRGGSLEARNFTPNIGALKSFDTAEQNYPMNRNFSSDGTSGRNQQKDTSNTQRPIRANQPVIHNQVMGDMVKIPLNNQFVYITPYEYNRRKSDLTINQNVFKIPSQRILIDNSRDGLL